MEEAKLNGVEQSLEGAAGGSTSTNNTNNKSVEGSVVRVSRLQSITDNIYDV